MRVHVIYAHPLKDSFAAALHARVLEGLRRAGHEVDDLDLYAEGFDPVLSDKERRAYEAEGLNEKAVLSYVERLRRAEALVLCFPTWWYGMPAILKGYFDRVWVPGVAFHLRGGGGALHPALTQIRKLGVVTTYGAPWWLIRFLVRDPVRSVIFRGLRLLLARGAKTLYLAQYNIDGSTPSARARFLAKVEAKFARF